MDVEIKIWIALIIIGSLPITIPVFFYLLPKLVRSYRIEKIAKEFRLQYQRKSSSVQLSLPVRRNILTGVVNNHNIEIYDFYQEQRMPWYWMFMFRRGLRTTTRRSTIFKIDGNEEEARGFLSGFAPIYRLRQILMDLDNHS